MIRDNDECIPANKSGEISEVANVDETTKVNNTNGNTLINRDNVLLPTPNETNFNKEKLTETIKDVSKTITHCLNLFPLAHIPAF